jgi:AcrR family transcriptional regulator
MKHNCIISILNEQRGMILSIKIDYQDRRILKSKRAMKEALLSLMKENDLKDITISDIAREADLNRGTFYKHYQLTEDVWNEIINEVIFDLTESFREPYKNIEVLAVNELTTSVIKIFEHVAKYKDFYTLIVHSETLVGFQHRFCQILKELALKDLSSSLPDSKINKDIHISYQSYAILGMIIEWINGDFKYSSSYMAEQLLEILRHTPSNSVIKPCTKYK